MQLLEEGVSFADAWKGAERQVRAVLRARGCSPDDVDDLVQVTCEKALRASRDFDDRQYFAAWCSRVAINAFYDSRRAMSRVEFGAVSDADLGSFDDIASGVVERDELYGAIAKLPPKEKTAILSFLAGGEANEPGAIRTARSRASARLRTMLERLAVVITLRGGRALQTLRRMAGATPTVAAAVAVAVAAALGIHAFAHTPPPPHSRVARRTKTSSRVGSSGLIGSSHATSSPHRQNIEGPATQSPRIPMVRLPFLPGPDGSKQQITAGDDPSQTGQHICTGTALTGPRCVYTPFPSIDTLVP